LKNNRGGHGGNFIILAQIPPPLFDQIMI